MSAFLLPPGAPWGARAATTTPVLVSLYLRGGADGLSLVVPSADPVYYQIRPRIQVPAGSEIALDGFFGLNPALQPLHALYQGGDLCVVHACGSPDPTRSHFDAQDYMDRAAPGDKSVLDGWLNRYLLATGQTDAVSGISLKTTKVKSLEGAAPSLALTSVASFVLSGALPEPRRAALESRYALIPGTLLGGNALDAFGTLDAIASVDTATAVAYPQGSRLGAALRETAALIKADIGVRVVAIDSGGWDHHAGQVASLAPLGGDLAASLAAFHQDLGPCAATTLTLCMTEFGRRAAENGSLGTDHGHGGVMFALGGGVAGGRVLTRDGWPGLAPAQLYDGKDLEVTTDFRDVFAEALVRHMGLSVAQAAPVFPDFGVETARFPGLFL